MKAPPSLRMLRGHLPSGLFTLWTLVAVAGACQPRGGGGIAPLGGSSSDAFAELLNPLSTYRAMGFVTGTREFNAVGRFGYLAGPGDSTLILFGCSFPNNALQFQRGESGYVAQYRVTLTLRQDGGEVRRLSEVQQVQVASFRETGRTEESIVYQTRQPALPGAYVAEVEVRDVGSGKGFRESVDLLVPDLGAQAQPLSAPLVVYRVHPRSSPDDPPSLILSPRATTPFARGGVLVYVEGYGTEETAALDIWDSSDEIVWRDTVSLLDQGALRSAVISIPAEILPVGAFQIRAGLLPDGPTASAPILVGLSDHWILSNFSDIVSLLRYAAGPAELDSLRNAPPGERAERWRNFWAGKDPIPATVENEFLDDYFARVREANRLFREQQRAGWLTDRGEVYITFGAPDQVFSATEIGPGSRLRWLYDRSLGFELRLDFIDRTGFGTYELTPDSRSRFREAIFRSRAAT